MQNHNSNNLVQITNLYKAFSNKIALDNINLTIPKKGGIIALLGHNGAGKTTLINCLLGLCRSDSGQIEIFNSKPSSQHVKTRIGAMLQDTDLPDLLTTREHLTLFASYYPNSRSVKELISSYELSDFADKLYKNLSGGQKRRVQMAIALIGKGELLFLDEPTNGLDSSARRLLWTKVKQLADKGKTILLSTHYLEEADALAERVIVLHQGKIIADAPTPEIRKKLTGSIIRCISRLNHSELSSLATVRSVQQSGRFVNLHCLNPVKAMHSLLALDPGISELSISKPGLEEVLENLSKQQTVL